MLTGQVLWLLLVLLAGFSTTAQARSYDDVIASGYLDIAVYREFPPYSFMDSDGPAGIDIEIGKLIAADLKLEPRWFWLTADENLEDDLRNAIWKGQILDPEKKKADLMLRVPYDRKFSYAVDGYGLPKNELVHMFAPYQRESWALARNLEKTGDVRNLAIFRYEKVAVEIDSLPDFFLGSTLGGRLRDNLVHVLDVYAGLEQLEAGTLGAVAGMRGQLQWGLSRLAGQYDLSADGLQAMSLRAWDIGMAVKSDYRQFSYAVEAIVEKRIADGSITAIFQQYQLSYEQPSIYAD
ncbi:transporter substrate-binding domain-containing protein [Pseudomaricurvus alcaniphilus]|uniref:substrate-binding periplasmic protein n=1 Tax=Pseudomaricurvus alcaniphilus TaxID=1166482 RepID=UPI00140BCF01|nr:transporter substrate-binding domain-containing protein [Pseudomaricurvus alcaniphilus]NHN39772.1 transporter substrate-binding domain-containing protein [Pseudomaricurvus alcaniphilus]